MHLEKVNYKPNFNTIDLVFDSTEYEDDQYSHLYFEVGELRIYIKDDFFEDVQKQCEKLNIPVYIYT